MAVKGTTKPTNSTSKNAAVNTTKKSNVVTMAKKPGATKAAAAEPDAPAKKTKAKKADSKYIGKSSGMRVQQFQDELMKKNYKAKLTDTELAEAMRKEFPNAVAFEEKHVAGIRSQFNNGRRPSQEGQKPPKPLAKFDDEGNEMNPRAVGKKKKEDAPAGKKGKKGKAAPAEEEEETDEETDEETEEEEEEEAEDE